MHFGGFLIFSANLFARFGIVWYDGIVGIYKNLRGMSIFRRGG